VCHVYCGPGDVHRGSYRTDRFRAQARAAKRGYITDILSATDAAEYLARLTITFTHAEK
jgi:hypothetical protein